MQLRAIAKEQRADIEFTSASAHVGSEPRFSAPPPVPKHAYSAADLPSNNDRGDRGKAVMQGLAPGVAPL
eukprot:7294841-Prymnesium_polylepis.1